MYSLYSLGSYYIGDEIHDGCFPWHTKSVRPRLWRLEVFTKLYFMLMTSLMVLKTCYLPEFLWKRRLQNVLSPRGPAAVSFDDICTIMTTHLQPQPSEIVQRFRFNTRSRLPQESVATYVTKLKRLAETCNFGDTARLNEMMRDRLVCGVANEKWQQRLLAEDNLTYEKAFKILLSVEASEEEVKDLSSSVNGMHATTVHQLRRHSSRQHYPSNSQEKRKTGDKSENPVKTWKPCYHCGGEHHSDKWRPSAGFATKKDILLLRADKSSRVLNLDRGMP